MRRLDFYWRLAVTGACFAVLWAGCVLFLALAFPVLRTLAPPPERRRCAQWLINRYFLFLLSILRTAGVMRIEVRGMEFLREADAALVIANHPSYLDVFVLLALMPRATCVVKGGVWDHPLMAAAVRTAGYISNSAPEELVEHCKRSLAAGEPLLIFPEGTRTSPDEPLRFLRGAARIALESERPIVPVLLHCDPPTLTKGERWYQVPSRQFRFRVVVKQPRPAADFAAAEPAVLSPRRLTHALEHYFSRELSTL